MKTFKRILVASLLLVVIVGIGLAAGLGGNLLHDTSESTKAAVTNVVLDASGYKQKAAQALEDNREKISAATGMSLDEVDAAIANLDIESWQACPLPSNAVSTDSFSANYGGMSGTITTYEDPSYVTIKASGQEVTLEVPDSAQGYLPYLAYL